MIGLLVAGVGARFGLGATRTVEANLDAPPRTYVWSDAPLIGLLNDVVRALFWRDTSEPGRVYGAVQEYLWLRSRHFDVAREIADHIHGNTGPGDAIFGDTLVALLANRRLASEIADTSEMRFESGVYTVEECWRDINRGGALYIILPGPPTPSLADIPGFLDRLADEFILEREFRDPAYGKIGVFRRVSTPTAPRRDR